MLELAVEKVQGALVGLWSALDGEHALAALVVGHLGNRDSGAGQTADLGDLGASSA